MKRIALFLLLNLVGRKSCRAGAQCLVALIPFLVLAFTHGATAATLSFKPAVNYTVGANPIAIATGDFNGDGKMDLAVVASGDPATGQGGGVSILLGNGDGTFGGATNLLPDKHPGSISVADFNGDTRLDLAVIIPDAGAGSVDILLGNGDGTFQAPVDYPTGNGPKMVAVGDLNGDHKPDLVIPNLFDATVSVLLGNGDGSFQSRMDSAVAGAPAGVAITDLDADGKADLVVPAVKSGVAILLGNGDGTFHQAVFQDPGIAFGPIAVLPGDFNGDGNPDLMVEYFIGVSCCPPASLYRGDLMVGNGDGTFNLVQGAADLGGNVAQTDFDGDRKLDLVMAFSTRRVSVLLGNGDGTFANPGLSLAVGFFPSAVTTADLNGDKAPDIIVTNAGDNTVSILLNNTGTDFSLSASAADPATLNAGDTANSTISLALLNAFDNPVSLACSVQPLDAGSPNCSFRENPTVFDASGKASAQMSITAATRTALLAGPSTLRWLYLPVFGCALAAASFKSARMESKYLTLLTLISFSVLLSLAACGGGGAPRQAQNYTIKITGTAGTTSHSTAINVTVR